ncbi:MAG: mucoidy inhibitor MuiA family protein [Deltaproteobacteria bacterium]|nr:mucoidy inhibitor MuiA family protein [Deltaproteobacteria bacterium]
MVPLAILFLTTAFPSPVFSAEYSSRVDRVVLYTHMAEVSRVVEVDKPETIVVLPGLTPNLLPDTLSARVERGGARIAGVTVEEIFRTEPVDERVKELKRRIEDLTAEKRRAEAAIQAFQREKKLLERGVLAIYSGGEEGSGKENAKPPRLSAAEVEKALSLFRDRDQAIDGMVFDRERKIQDLEKKIQVAKQELDKIRTPRPKQEKVVRIDMERPAQCRLVVTYLVPAAGFVPRYNVMLRPSEGALAFELGGEAWQRTGEDWEDASFTFSTAQPGRMAQLPPLPPWDLDFRRPPVARPMGRGFHAKSELAVMDAVEEKAAQRAAGAPPPERKFASFEVTLEGRHSLPGDGEKKMFRLARQEQTTKVAWRSIPRVTDGAFLAADGRNETGLPIFAAPAGLFLEDAYAGKGRLPDIPEGEEFKIDFGKDPGVQVKRKERMRRREDGGVFAKVKRVRFRYEITVHNFRKETVPLTVLDRIPVPRHKDIVVKDVEITGGGKQEEQGEIKWVLSLAKGEKKVLELSFTVEYPADKEIHGL